MPTSKRERQRQNREERRRREEQVARRARMFRLARRAAIIVVLVIGAGVIFSLITGDDSTDTTQAATTTAPVTTVTPTTTSPTRTTIASGSTTPPDTSEPPTTVPPTTLPPPATGYADFRAMPTACGADAPPELADLQFDTPEDQDLGAGPVTATVETSCGDIVVEMDPESYPETVNSFVFLARQGYFDGSVSHRISPGFVIQAGDPTATGRGGPGYFIADEFPAAGFSYARGVVAMANAGPGSTGSQFFIVLADAALGPQFNVLGTVVEGMDVADRIATLPLTASAGLPEQSSPLEALYIERVTITNP